MYDARYQPDQYQVRTFYIFVSTPMSAALFAQSNALEENASHSPRCSEQAFKHSKSLQIYEKHSVLSLAFCSGGAGCALIWWVWRSTRRISGTFRYHSELHIVRHRWCLGVGNSLLVIVDVTSSLLGVFVWKKQPASVSVLDKHSRKSNEWDLMSVHACRDATKLKDVVCWLMQGILKLLAASMPTRTIFYWCKRLQLSSLQDGLQSYSSHG